MATIFSVSPMSQSATLTPGKTYEGAVGISNPADATADFNYAVDLVPYDVTDASYTVDLTTMSTRSQIVEWTTLENAEGAVKPNETQYVKYKITVPMDAPAGGQYFALAVHSNDAIEGEGNVELGAVFEILSVVYAEVEGETVQEGGIKANNVPGFTTNSDLDSSVVLSNTGNVHATAKITVEVKDLWTGQTIFPLEGEENEFSELVMPGTTREITREIERISDLGMYEITQTVDYMDETSTTSHVVFSCPIWLVGLAGVFIAVLAWTIVKIVRRNHKKHNFTENT